MNDAALHLTERVLPEVPVRQWVCSLPWQLRYVLGYDRVLCAAVLRAFAVGLSASYRRRAKREHALPSVSMLHTGSVTFVQRVDSALRLNVHAHVLSLDGVYLRKGSRAAPEALSWLSLDEPTDADVQELTERSAARVERVLRAHGRYLDDEHHALCGPQPTPRCAREIPLRRTAAAWPQSRPPHAEDNRRAAHAQARPGQENRRPWLSSRANGSFDWPLGLNARSSGSSRTRPP